MEKHYAADPVKSKARGLLRDMIAKHLSFKRPEEIRVLCLPGIDAAEVYEVYDPLGIPRGNIVGIERDSGIAAKIREKGSGIQLVQGSVEDYLAAQKSIEFDVVSLDYTGPLTEKNLEAVEAIGKKTRKRFFILHHANLAKREKDTSTYLFSAAISDKMIKAFTEGLDCKEERKFMNPALEAYADLRKKLDATGDLHQPRSDGYTSALCGLLFYDDRNKTNRFLAGEEEWHRLSQQAISEAKSRGIDISTEDLFCDKVPVWIQLNLIGRTAQVWKRRCEEADIKHANVVQVLASAISARTFGMWDNDFVRYSYISDSGAPMLGDILCADRDWKFFSAAKDLAYVIGWPASFCIKDRGMMRNKLRDFGKQLERLPKPPILNMKPRIFLGSSAKPVLTKDRAITEFKAGASVEEILSKYRYTDGKPLAQWKAHVTMGTYDQIPESDLVSDAAAEKISKEQALDLLNEGIPVDEIHAAWPTFTLGQLRAFKAHITMGTYPDLETKIKKST